MAWGPLPLLESAAFDLALGADGAGVLLARALDLGLAGFFAVRLRQVAMSMCRGEVAFAVLAAFNQGFDVIRVPRLACLNRQFADMADAAEPVIDAQAHAGRNRRIVVATDPFWKRARHQNSFHFGQTLGARGVYGSHRLT